MPYLITSDYLLKIQQVDLDTIDTEAGGGRTATEYEAQEHATSILRSRYKADGLFPDVIPVQKQGYQYKEGQIVHALEDYFEDWDAAVTYPQGSIVISEMAGTKYLWGNNTEVTDGGSPYSNPSVWTGLATVGNWYTVRTTFDPAGDNGTPLESDDPNLTEEQLAALPIMSHGKTDPRISTLVAALVDIVIYNLHTRTQPHQIPDLRVKRYDDAIKWLKQAIDPRFDMTPPMTEKTFNDNEGVDVSFGSGTQNNKDYNLY